MTLLISDVEQRTLVPRPVPELEINDERVSLDWLRIAAAASSLLAFVVLAVSAACGWSNVRTVAVLFSGYIGLGSASLQFARGFRGLRYVVMSVGLGLAAVSLLGFTLIELKLWRFSEAVFIALCLVAASLHTMSLKRGLVDSWSEATRQIEEARATLFSSRSLRNSWLTWTGLVLCMAGELVSHNLVPGHGGLPLSISPLWISGIAALALGVVLAWRDSDRSVAFPMATLLVVLVSTPAVVYQLPRYDWSQKHVGVTLHFLQYGVLNGKTDIYQSWPAFFAGVGWLGKSGHFMNIEAVARWWPAATDAFIVVVIYHLGRTLGLSQRRCWFAAALFTLGNTIGQDYFSPQNAAFVLFLTVFALCLHPDGPKATFRWLDWTLFIVFVVTIAVTHQLTPFATAGILLVFALFGLTRRRVLPVIAFIPAAIWTLLHFDQVRRYFNVAGVGNLAANVKTPNASAHYHYIWQIRFGDLGQATAPLLVGLLAVVALVTWRMRITYGLAAAAASCSVLVVAVHYGDEDIYRATLFALPFLALLAAHIHIKASKITQVALVGLLCVMVGAYTVGDMGFDDIYVTRPGDVAAALYFERTAPVGSVIITTGSYSGDAPLASPRYPLYRYGNYLTGGLPPGLSVPEVATAITQVLEVYFHKSGVSKKDPRHVYILATQQAAAQLADDGVMSIPQFRQLQSELLRTGHWKVVYRTPTSLLLQITS